MTRAATPEFTSRARSGWRRAGRGRSVTAMTDIAFRSDTDTQNLHALYAGDPAFDGAFVYAVTSTGVYCRPSCRSRRPKPENVRIFGTPAEAVRAGFRACRRCHPDDAKNRDPQLAALGRVCAAIDAADTLPSLTELGEIAGLSPHHLQRVFTRRLGISPKAYGDARRLLRLKAGLKSGNGVADAVYAAGFGSASRVYERAAGQLGMTPATYAKGGAGAALSYAIAGGPLGKLLVAATARGVAAVYLGDSERALTAELAAEFPEAMRVRDDGRLTAELRAILRYLRNQAPPPALPLDVRATAFQRRVWQELQRIPLGQTRSYAEVAKAIGAPKAVRAVGHACATNPVSLLIPCHRVHRTDGGLGGYRWGLDRKEALLAAEAKAARKSR